MRNRRLHQRHARRERSGPLLLPLLLLLQLQHSFFLPCPGLCSLLLSLSLSLLLLSSLSLFLPCVPSERSKGWGIVEFETPEEVKGPFSLCLSLLCLPGFLSFPVPFHLLGSLYL